MTSNAAQSILIVEDEPLVAKDLTETLEDAGYMVCATTSNADDSIKILKSKQVLLVILDIHIEGNIDGLMLGKMIRQKFNLPIIFVTSHSDPDTLNQVKEINPASYLVKPFEDAELITNIELAIQRHKDSSSCSRHPEMEKVKENSAFIRHNGSLVKVRLNDILYAEADDNYCYIHTQNTKYLLCQTLKSIEEKLDKNQFMRVHRSFLVNLEAIDVINEDHLIINKKGINISRASKQELMNRVSLL